MYPHRIHLRGPWDCEPIARVERHPDGTIEWVEHDLPPAARVTMPYRSNEGVFADFVGRIRFRRRFGSPRRLDAHERVWLTFTGARSSASIMLNGRLLGHHKSASDPSEFEVTSLLGERNELNIELEFSEVNDWLFGDVALEIRAAAFLREVRAWVAQEGDSERLHAAGQVVGTSDQPLDLYAILDRATVAYSKLASDAFGTSFHLISHALESGNFSTRKDPSHVVGTVRVELVHGGTVWYAVDVEAAIEGDRK